MATLFELISSNIIDEESVKRMAELTARRPKREPTHPGAILREDVIPEMGVSVSEFARRIGVSRQTLHKILAETDSITPNTALRIGKLIGNGPEIWLTMQQRYDLWRAERELRQDLERIEKYQESVSS